MSSPRFDVVVIGELLVELSASEPLASADRLEVSFSGDALNAAAAAVAAGARTTVISRVGDDEFGARLLAHARDLGIDTSLIGHNKRPNGLYIAGADPEGMREFVYLREGSSATTLGPQDLPLGVLREARALLIGGIACAISPSTRAAVELAARTVREAGGLVVYDPNYRSKLTKPEEAAEAFRAIAPYSTIATPSCPPDTRALFGTDDYVRAGRACLDAGVEVAVITLGAKGAAICEEDDLTLVPALPPPVLLDATGSGDVFAGTLTAAIALGTGLEDAVLGANAAASLSVGGRGGTGYIPRWSRTQEHIAENRGLSQLMPDRAGTETGEGSV